MLSRVRLRLLVLVHGAVALAGDVEDLAQADVRPDFGPLRLEIAVQRFAELVGGRLVVVLQEVDFGDAVVREGVVALGLERLLVFASRPR